MNSPGKAYSKLKWTPQVDLYLSKEEQLLRSLKQEKNIESWKIIANQMNQIFVEKTRSGKQCRQRYMNYVRFGNQLPKMTGWTPQEDQELFLKFMEHGAKWVQIGKQMPGRSQNCLKNRFYGAMRKIIRKINRAAKEKKLRQKKPIKADLLIRILEYEFNVTQEGEKNSLQAQDFLRNLKKQMIKIAINPDQNSSSDQIQSLIGGITKFCSIIKTPYVKKSVSKQKQQQNQHSEQDVEDGCSQAMESSGKQLIQEEKQKVVDGKEDTPKVEFKHKIVTNLILFSSSQLRPANYKIQPSLIIFQKNNSEQVMTSNMQNYKDLST